MTLEFVAWVSFGALAAWITSLLLRTDADRENTAATIAIGVIGAISGGVLFRAFAPNPDTMQFSPLSLIIAVVASVLSVLLVRRTRKSPHNHQS